MIGKGELSVPYEQLRYYLLAYREKAEICIKWTGHNFVCRGRIAKVVWNKEGDSQKGTFKEYVDFCLEEVES